jgi:hypothetical protein
MPRSKISTVPAQTVIQDIAAFNGLKSIKNYKPNRPDLAIAALEASYQSMLQAQNNAANQQLQQKIANDERIAAEKDFHSKVMDMKDSVKGQFGADSNEVLAIGFKRRSQRKLPSRTKTAANVLVKA